MEEKRNARTTNVVQVRDDSGLDQVGTSKNVKGFGCRAKRNLIS